MAVTPAALYAAKIGSGLCQSSSADSASKTTVRRTAYSTSAGESDGWPLPDEALATTAAPTSAPDAR